MVCNRCSDFLSATVYGWFILCWPLVTTFWPWFHWVCGVDAKFMAKGPFITTVLFWALDFRTQYLSVRKANPALSVLAILICHNLKLCCHVTKSSQVPAIHRWGWFNVWRLLCMTGNRPYWNFQRGCKHCATEVWPWNHPKPINQSLHATCVYIHIRKLCVVLSSSKPSLSMVNCVYIGGVSCRCVFVCDTLSRP